MYSHTYVPQVFNVVAETVSDVPRRIRSDENSSRRKGLSLKQGTGNRGMGMGMGMAMAMAMAMEMEWEWGTRNGEFLKVGIFKTGNL